MAQLIAAQAAATRTDMDVRQALARRLASLALEKRRLQSRLVLLDELEKELRNLLEGAEQPSLPNIEEPRRLRLSELVEEGRQGTALKTFLQEQLGQGPKTLDQLVVAARDQQFDFGDKSVARTLHFHLLNLKNSGIIEKDRETWRLKGRI